VALFPAIVALWDPRVHVGASDSGDATTVIKGVVNEKFCFGPILRVLYI